MGKTIRKGKEWGVVAVDGFTSAEAARKAEEIRKRDRARRNKQDRSRIETS